MKKYNSVEKILHKIVLRGSFVNKALFEIEKFFFLSKNDNDFINNKHCFIAGLPRSGTTILLNFLFQSKKFSSFKYMDMPFIISPNLYNKFKSKKNLKFVERQHGDGIEVNSESPEAFDEIFFKTFDKSDQIKYFNNFVKLKLISDQKKFYLSKNNNNYKRIEFILDQLQNSIILIPFRNPLDHSFSLMKQHYNFIKFQKNEKFILEYMNYLGHNEFGLEHKPWNEPLNYKNPLTINYWIEQWYFFYKFLFDQYQNNNSIFFISYEKLCNDDLFCKKLLRKLDIDNEIDFKFKKNDKEIREDYDQILFEKSQNLYQSISKLNFN